MYALLYLATRKRPIGLFLFIINESYGRSFLPSELRTEEIASGNYYTSLYVTS